MALFQERLTKENVDADPTSPEGRKLDTVIDHIAEQRGVPMHAVRKEVTQLLSGGSVLDYLLTDNNRVARYGWNGLPPPELEQPQNAAA